MEITYEVYTLEKGRWIIDSRYKSGEKEPAIIEAKTLAGQKHIEATKVVRETYDAEDNISREKVVYDSQKAGSGGSGGGGGGGGEPRFSADDDDGDDSGYGGPSGVGGSVFDDDGDEEEDERPVRRSRRGSKKAPGPPRVLARPGAVLFYKVVVIAVVSFGFAAATTFMYTRFAL